MAPAIRVENLSKCYRVNHEEGRVPYRTLREDLLRLAAKPWRWLRRQTGRQTEDFWALKEVSFDVRPGEVIGIIGRNGAGKSTLLKILSRITHPTRGKVRLRGRVGSLLEVGTGFHPELTGRENIVLNGVILGMGRREIARKFDEIVAFAEIEKFLDTPVKRYSSGMYVRLAFAVAAHLEPEILIVDEVLAVGDAAFQKKCLGKMRDVVEGGRTILFVSHNMVAVGQLCDRCLWLDEGVLNRQGPVAEVVDAYTRGTAPVTEGQFPEHGVQGDGRVQLLSYRVVNQLGQTRPLPVTNEDIFIQVRVRAQAPIHHPACGISITNDQGVTLTCINTVELGAVLAPLPAGEADLGIRLHRVPYLPGRYRASFWVMNPQCHIYARADNAISFEIGQGPLYGTREIDHRWGCVYTQVDFTVKA
jgi:lipopolysaccharide transport system ATP-binding protein